MTDFIDELFGDDDHDHSACKASHGAAYDLLWAAMHRLAEAPCTIEQMGEMVPTRFVLVAEHMDGDGERWVAPVVTEATEPWDAVGLLRWALRQTDSNRMVRLPA